MKSLKVACLFTCLMALSALGAFADNNTSTCPQNAAPCPSTKKPLHASVLLNPAKGCSTHGIVTFTAVEGGTLIIADVENLQPGKHAFIIHEYGDCSAPDGSSTGGHYNPTISRHGGPDHLCRHVGDLGNIVADDCGHGHYERIDKVISLEGCYSILGKSVCIHANADDYITQPNGNCGGRVAFGVID